MSVDSTGEEGVVRPTEPTPPAAGTAQEGTSAAGGGEGGPSRENPRGRENNNEDDDFSAGGREEHPVSYYQRMYNEDRSPTGKFWKMLRAQSPFSSGIDKNLIRFLARLSGPDSDKPMAYLVNKIVANPLDNEASDYRLGLYAEGNKETIWAELREAWLTAEDNGLKAQFRERDTKMRTTYEAVSLMHEMNRGISTAKIEDFRRMAEGITPEQQQVLQNVRGASQIMRLFEDEYQRLLMDDKRVTTEKNDELLGKSVRVETPDQHARAVGIVEGRLNELIKYVKSRSDISADSPLGQLTSLEDWEIGWAFYSGKLLYNLSLRAAEQISLSEVPEGDAAWRSPPQEHMVRIMNQVAWIWKRFGKGDTVGGKEYMELVQKHYKELRERHGYGTTGLARLAGKKIEDYEISSMFKVSGIFSSWRNRAIILDKAPMVVNGEKTTISKYIDAARTKKIEALKLEFAQIRGAKNWDRWIKTKEGEILEATYLENGKLRPEFTNALGVLLTYNNEIAGKVVEGGKLVPVETDAQFPGLQEMKKRIRAEIWKKVSQDNPLAVAYFLNGMEFEKGKEPKFTYGSAEGFRALANNLNTEKNPVWRSLREKLIIAREIRLAEIAKREGQPRGIEDILNAGGEQLQLSGDERKLMHDIQGYGKDVSFDLASVRLPFNPFMSDVIFEEADYKGAGNVYYSRRIGDIGGIYNSYEALTKVIGQAAVVSREEAMKALKEAIAALDGPNGWGNSQDEVLPFFMALLDFWDKGGNISGPGKWLAKDNLYGPLAKSLKIPNSIAQKYGGTNAIAYDEFAMRGLLDEAYSLGITRKEIRDKDGFLTSGDMDDFLRKKKKVKLQWWLLAMLRDFTKIFFAASVYEAYKDVRKPEGK